jgi:hypothetical protein
MTDKDIIIALGGSQFLSGILGVLPNAVSNWKTRGIPWRSRPIVKKIAKRKNVKLPSDFLTKRLF